MKILGLTGVAGSGKSTMARLAVRRCHAVPLSFADYFKIPAVALDGLPQDEVFGAAPKSEAVRAVLQKIGAEMGRDLHGPDVWVKHMHAHLYRLALAGVERVVIDDVRFHNEAAMIRRADGEVWRLTGRGGLTGANAGHRSEQDIAYLLCDREFDNDPAHGPRCITRVTEALHQWMR